MVRAGPLPLPSLGGHGEIFVWVDLFPSIFFDVFLRQDMFLEVHVLAKYFI